VQLSRLFASGVHEIMAYPISPEGDPRETIRLLADAASLVRN
jgi:hypothetical protein